MTAHPTTSGSGSGSTPGPDSGPTPGPTSGPGHAVDVAPGTVPSPGDGPPPSPGGAGARIAWALAAALVLAVAVVTVVLDVRVSRRPLPTWAAVDPAWVPVLLGLSLAVPGGLLLRRLPRHPIALVLTGCGLGWLLNGLAGAWIRVVVFLRPDLPAGSVAEWIYNRLGPWLVVGLVLLLLLFPDGHLPHERLDRAVARVALVGALAVPFVLLLVPTPVLDAFRGDTPPPELAALRSDALALPLPAGVWTVALWAAYAVFPLGIVGPVAVVVLRYRRAEGERRLQLRWLVWAGLITLLSAVAVVLLPDPIPFAALGLAITTSSVAVVVAVARYRLYDVDRLLPTTVVAAMLGLLVLAVDGLVLLVAGSVMGGRDSALVAVAVVAVLYTPLRTRLWRAARRVVRGGREDPYDAVATLAGRLESAAAPGEQLGALARSVAEAFRLPYVRVEIDRADGVRAAVEHGRPTGTTVELPVHYRDETIGRVVLSGGRALSEPDQRLLGDLLRQAAAAARAGALGASLQRARAALVTAREEERRRLRRDLHDSLGPGLAAVTLRVETARALAERDPQRADAVLDEVTGDVARLLADVRRLVHDLRPPALDEMGLAGALRQLASRLGGPDLAITVSVVTPEGVEPGGDDLGPLPAAVEVAAFRIVSEALTNVVRHAGASRATVVLRRSPTGLDVEVTDDGRGIGAEVVAGVGTLSVRERAAELGGTSTVSCPDDGGTVVAAHLPVEEDV